jgi:hypothetical protein
MWLEHLEAGPGCKLYGREAVDSEARSSFHRVRGVRGCCSLLEATKYVSAARDRSRTQRSELTPSPAIFPTSATVTGPSVCCGNICCDEGITEEVDTFFGCHRVQFASNYVLAF